MIVEPSYIDSLRADIIESWDAYFDELIRRDFQRGHNYLLFDEEDLRAMASISLETFISNLLMMLQDCERDEKHTY